jgi:hypothetical protein
MEINIAETPVLTISTVSSKLTEMFLLLTWYWK